MASMEEEVLSEYEKIRVNNILERENLLKDSGVLTDIGALKKTEMSKTVTFNLIKKSAPAKKPVKRKRKTFEEENKEIKERRTNSRNKKKSMKQKEAEEAQSWSGE